MFDCHIKEIPERDRWSSLRIRYGLSLTAKRIPSAFKLWAKNVSKYDRYQFCTAKIRHCIFASNVATFSHESCHPSRSKIATPEFPLKTPCRT